MRAALLVCRSREARLAEKEAQIEEMEKKIEKYEFILKIDKYKKLENG